MKMINKQLKFKAMKTQRWYQEMRKSKHAIDRQFDRDVDDFLLEKIGWKIDSFRKGKTLYIITLKTLKQCGYKGTRQFLILVMRSKTLITLFFEDNFRAIYSKRDAKSKFVLI